MEIKVEKDLLLKAADTTKDICKNGVKLGCMAIVASGVYKTGKAVIYKARIATYNKLTKLSNKLEEYKANINKEESKNETLN